MTNPDVVLRLVESYPGPYGEILRRLFGIGCDQQSFRQISKVLDIGSGENCRQMVQDAFVTLGMALGDHDGPLDIVTVRRYVEAGLMRRAAGLADGPGTTGTVGTDPRERT